ncbi:GGDEF domain-containing protein [Marinibactrum halimedae]|uniref:GGDEF domain-containing protein n=1 Tax=Marinibactrum halimedae TaxID=1444977 RepID=UPI001E48D0A2|nr:GGDEF domain-containing protein [Marinibactrum halimedae]MCD9459582.1 GGDEF domain-containing protein [Marinibactrum halimedae]
MDLSWTDIISESFILLFNIVLIVVILRARLSDLVFWPLFLGFVLLFFSGVPDLIDEITQIDSLFLSAQENIGYILGMLMMTLGFYLWGEEYRLANHRLLQSEKKYKQLSITDSLTGLYNSGYFFNVLSSEIALARRYQLSLSLIVMDIDDFKSHNDRYGHIEGDKVIAAMGHEIKAVLREIDKPFRYGGEEFVILLPRTNLYTTYTIAERIRKAVLAIEFEPKPGEVVKKSVSIGVAELTEEDLPQLLVARADAAMYLAKRQGKNRVVSLTSEEHMQIA